MTTRTPRLPLSVRLALLVCCALARGNLLRFASIRTWEYRESMAREEVPAPVETVFIAVPPRRATLHV